MKPILIRLLLATLMVFGMSGCLLDYETAVTPDPKADPRLEGVWQITKKVSKEIRSDRDEDDIGVKGYIIFAKLDEGTYKGIMFDEFERDSPSKFPEVLVLRRASRIGLRIMSSTVRKSFSSDFCLPKTSTSFRRPIG